MAYTYKYSNSKSVSISYKSSLLRAFNRLFVASSTFSRTYVSNKTKRSVTNEEMINMVEAEKRLVTELGENVCIYPKVCLYQADKARRNSNRNREVQVDWNEVFNNYKTSKEKQKEFYFLSVFLGDFIASPKFCNHLVKLGRSCKD
ncbi:hypothetical protein ABEB36_011233 [Hypothenemus hampei]|uniref:Uncharacterized protein n=1 Tax=Hypothenemus hampei TaxID=57062 RepID=A0ABD1EEN7_HYPHA